ncbi:diguanylate cyclase [Noviherbaspirillum sp.]|uniref:diguanylate cyclase n=1 Tax=Noviherbaspirillum sp. TaxID=1926288 RepID=UPI002FE37F62
MSKFHTPPPESRITATSNRKTPIVCTVLVFALVLVLACVYVYWRAYKDSLSAGMESNRSLAIALEEHAQRSFDSVELTLETIAKELNGVDLATWAPGRAEWERYRAYALRQPQVSSIAVIDKQGDIRLLTTDYPWARFSTADREFFKAHRDQRVHLFLSAPIVSRFNGKPIFTLGLRLQDRQGDFNGILLASMEISYFSQFYSSLDLGPNGSVALIRRDGKTLLREPAIPGNISPDLGKDKLFTELIPTAPVGTFTTTSPFDKAPRILAYRASSHSPFVVVATKSVPELLSPVKRRALWGMIALSAVLSMMFVFTRLLLKGLDREERQKKELISARDFAESVLDSVDAHIAIVDQNGIIRRTNSAWREFAKANGYRKDLSSDGESYFASVSDGEAQNGPDVAAGIRSVMARSSNSFEAEYPCHSPEARRWFNMRVRPLRMDDGTVVIVHQDVSRLKLIEEELRKLASHDALTGLLNRRALLEIGEVEFGRARRYGYPLSIILLDCDHFKRVNDSFGHGVGDKVLVRFAGILTAAVRDADHVSRLGGEEFVVILPHTPLDGAIQLADRLRLSIMGTPIKAGGAEIWCTASFGVAELTTDNLTFTNLLNTADKAMYKAKASGRNRVEAVTVAVAATG